MWKMYPRPTNVKILEKYKLLITFKDGSIKIFDMETLLDQPPFKRLSDYDMFSTVKISEDGATLEWDNGCDICPDQLYEDGIKTDEEDVR